MTDAEEARFRIFDALRKLPYSLPRADGLKTARDIQRLTADEIWPGHAKTVAAVARDMEGVVVTRTKPLTYHMMPAARSAAWAREEDAKIRKNKRKRATARREADRFQILIRHIEEARERARKKAEKRAKKEIQK